MNDYKEYNGGCYFHPKEEIIGVCHLCLNERLLILAAKQGLKGSHNSSKLREPINNNDHCRSNNHNLHKSKPSISISSKIFALGSLLSRKDDIRHRHNRKTDHEFVDFADDIDPDTTSTSLEDESFISIKFGDNGVASWDKSTTNAVSNSKVSLEHCSMSWGGQTAVKHSTHKGNNSDNNNINDTNNKSVVEHAKPRAPLRWQKRIGQLLQVIRWKKSSKANAGGKSSRGEGVKVVRKNRGWIRTLRMSTKK